MANYWVITIGINQYRHIQPLMHAQNDALFIHKFFTEEADIAANHSVLLSDLATSVGAQVVYPDKPAIAQWIQTITTQVGPGDVLWFFFSGYGTQLEGADYLMPIDGDLDRIEETGIALTDLIEALAQLPTDKAVLVLDINRSQGALAGQTIGMQAIELAEKRQVATLLSCQPEQYSHETLGVRHGLFTAALLEALQQGYSTLGHIGDYLTKRLPELCEHHWRPVQNAVIVSSQEQRIATIVPELTTSINSIASATASLEPDSHTLDSSEPIVGELVGESNSSSTAQTEQLAAEAVAVGVGAGAITSHNRLGEHPHTEESSDVSSYRGGGSAEQADSTRNSPAAKNTSALATVKPNGSSALVPYAAEPDQPGAINGARLRNWGLLALALLMGLVLLKQPFARSAWNNLIDRLEVATGWTSEDTDGASTIDDDPETAAAIANATAADPADSSTAPSSDIAPESEESGADAIAEAETSTRQPDGQTAAAPTNAESTKDASSANEKAKVLIAQAEAALEKKQYSEALIALKEVPKGQRDSKFSSVLIKARVGASEAEQTNAALLTDALTAIQPAQASQFTEAIAKARLIQPGEPLYEDAQKNIQSWSQTILDISEGRAASGSLAGAIAAAKVMPRDNADAYQKAQNKIAFWEQRQQSREIIEVAKTIPKTGQANTYQKGIVKLREVPIEHPEYEISERLADEWSQRIFSIAQARAAQGKQEAAIQAAVLVPAGTTAYEPTQQAIRRWQTEIQN